MILGKVFLLLVIYQLKHFMCDYPWQTPYMLGKFKGGWDWVRPLTAHASVHALLSFLIALAFTNALGFSIFLAALDFSLHFLMDRFKASPNMLGRYKTLSASEFPSATPEQIKGNRYFWWALGIDQMWHHLTHYALIYLILWKTGL